MEHVTRDDLRRIVDEVATDAFAKLATALGLSGGSVPRGPVGYDCTGTAFTCGDYTCTGAVGCAGEFGCTIKFSGLTRFTG